jgi:anti-anti-sigma factor
MSDLTVLGERVNDLLLLRLQGEASIEHIGELDRIAREGLAQGGRNVLVDLSGLAFMDSASAGAFLRLRGEVQDLGGRLILHSLPPVVGRMVERTRLDEALCIAADASAARALLG